MRANYDGEVKEVSVNGSSSALLYQKQKFDSDSSVTIQGAEQWEMKI